MKYFIICFTAILLQSLCISGFTISADGFFSSDLIESSGNEDTQENDIKETLQELEIGKMNEMNIMDLNGKDKELMKQRDWFVHLFGKPEYQPMQKEAIEHQDFKQVFAGDNIDNCMKTFERLVKKEDQFFLFLFEYLLGEMSSLEKQVEILKSKYENAGQFKEMKETLNEMDGWKKFENPNENVWKAIEKMQNEFREYMKDIKEKLDQIRDPLKPLKTQIHSMSEKLEKLEKTTSEKLFDPFYMDDTDMII